MRYKAYKTVDLPWLKEVPEHWEVKNVNSLFDERREKVSDKEYPPLSVTKNGILPQLENVAKSMATDNRKKVLKGDFVINSRSDRKGSSGLSSYDGSVSLISTVITPRIGYGIYWHYLLKSNDFIEEYYRNGKGIVADLWSTNFQSMKSILLPVPPKEEQEQIANFLDWKISEIDRLIEKRKDKLLELDKTKQLVLDDCYNNLDGEKSKLKYFGKFIKSGKLSRSDETDFSNYKALLYGDIYTKYNFTFDKCITMISEQAYFNNPKISGDTLFFTTSGESREEIGKCVLYSGEEEIAIGGDLIVFKPNKNINAQYLMYSLNTSQSINYRYIQARGEIIIHISESKIANSEIKLPTLQKQRIFAQKVTECIKSINSIKSKIISQIQQLELLKQSLIADAVTGKMDVRKMLIPEVERLDKNAIQEEVEVGEDGHSHRKG